MAKQQSTEH